MSLYLIKKFQEQLEKIIQYGGSRNEGAISSAFQNLLNEYCKTKNLLLIPQLDIKTKEDEANFKDSVVPMILEGTMPEEANFSIFTFVPDAVTVYFAQYQVAPYAMGGSREIMSIYIFMLL